MEQELQHFLIVSNDTLHLSEKLKDHFPNLTLRLINSPTNKGSAYIIKTGLDYIRNSDFRFIWILDDDNKPSKTCLEHLISTWNDGFKKNQNKQMVASFRSQMFYKYKYLVFTPEGHLTLLPYPRSFLGFHWKIPFLILTKKFRLIKPSYLENETQVVKCNAAVYGGLFFSVDTLKYIKEPDTRYFLYYDDIDFTSRIIKSGGEILLATQAKIEDIDDSSTAQKISLYNHPLFNIKSSFKAYHLVRSFMIYSDKLGFSHTMSYRFNGVAFLFILFVVSIVRLQMPRFLLILKTVIKGV